MNNLTQAQIDSAKNLKCEKCNSETFEQIFVIKQISRLITGGAKDMFAPVPIFSCYHCKHVNQLFADELKINQDQSKEIAHVQV